MPINVAIDGPAGAGKSTIAKAAAKALGFVYVDTGALYRAIAYYVISHGGDAKDEKTVEGFLDEITPELKYVDGLQRVIVNGEDVTDKLRTPRVSMGASAVSAVPAVRDFLFELQRKIARENNVIMDGRDIGTVVLPDADVKIFLTASAVVRAGRRYSELIEKGNCTPFATVLDEVNKRDYNDMHREVAPLKMAEDAVLLDTTDIDADKAVDMVIKLISGDGGAPGGEPPAGSPRG